MAKRVTTSRVFLFNKTVSEKQATTNGHKYLLKAGFIRQCFSGGYFLLPSALKCLEKLVNLIDKEMQQIGGVKIIMPILTPSLLWKHSGRWKIFGNELFQLKSSPRVDESEFCLGPTHEEMITDFVSQELKSYKQLPLRVYQLDRKFRNERRPRHGLLRSKEFWMKDMYTFDGCQEDAETTYDIVCKAYERIFDQLNIPTTKVLANPGNIGGSLSHEYHVTAPVGEDALIHCDRCGLGCNSEVVDLEAKQLPNCPENGVNCNLKKTNGIEVAHAFYLGKMYSRMFNATFIDQHNKKRLHFQMGCYGIGVSRLLQAIVEHQLMKSELMVWPLAVAPFTVCIIPLYYEKDPTGGEMIAKSEKLYDTIQTAFPGEVIIEDRSRMTIGDKLKFSSYPVNVIIGSKTPPGMVELHISVSEDKFVEMVEEQCLIERLKEIILCKN